MTISLTIAFKGVIIIRLGCYTACILKKTLIGSFILWLPFIPIYGWEYNCKMGSWFVHLEVTNLCVQSSLVRLGSHWHNDLRIKCILRVYFHTSGILWYGTINKFLISNFHLSVGNGYRAEHSRWNKIPPTPWVSSNVTLIWMKCGVIDRHNIKKWCYWRAHWWIVIAFAK